jgi:hypothetical protein
MIYILHHSKGSLLLSADDREQVMRWSERQLGRRAGIVSVTERDCMDAAHSVEKDGTGITAMEASECHPIMGIMADCAQDVQGEHGRSAGHGERLSAHLRVKEPTWHWGRPVASRMLEAPGVDKEVEPVSMIWCPASKSGSKGWKGNPPTEQGCSNEFRLLILNRILGVNTEIEHRFYSTWITGRV